MSDVKIPTTLIDFNDKYHQFLEVEENIKNLNKHVDMLNKTAEHNKKQIAELEEKLTHKREELYKIIANITATPTKTQKKRRSKVEAKISVPKIEPNSDGSDSDFVITK